MLNRCRIAEYDQARFPKSSEKERIVSVGHMLYYRYFDPAIMYAF